MRCPARLHHVAWSALRVSSSTPAVQPSLKVPRENNRFLCWPNANDSKQLLIRNQAIFNQSSLPIWFGQLRSLAREQALSSSRKYLLEYAPSLAQSISLADLDNTQLVVGGHQPELFHPGVWFKNFLLSAIGKHTNSVGLQVIIDHDVARSDSLRVPTCSITNVAERSALEFAQRTILLPIREESHARQPWHATVADPLSQAAWNKTLLDVRQAITACGLAQPLLLSRAQTLQECILATKNIGEAFSRFRHVIEMENGVYNLEVPIGHLCAESAFGLFVLHCVRNSESLWRAYNGCRDSYRSRHKIRNQVQPVLELQKRDDWLELPFWIYPTDSGAVVDRKRLWVRKQNSHMLLCDHVEASLRTVSVALPLNEHELPNTWNAIQRSGICIRPRALMTTMYLRCFIADLFVHGIGGGTYDELTDDIIRHWLGMDPPAYLTSSASLHLPFETSSEVKQIDPSTSWHVIQRELHLMRSVPERFLDRSIDAQRALFESHLLHIANIPERGKKFSWHKEIAQIKLKIEAAIEPKRQAACSKLDAILREMQRSKILKSREYSFVLFEEQDVVVRLKKLAKAALRQGTEAGK